MVFIKKIPNLSNVFISFFFNSLFLNYSNNISYNKKINLVATNKNNFFYFFNKILNFFYSSAAFFKKEKNNLFLQIFNKFFINSDTTNFSNFRTSFFFNVSSNSGSDHVFLLGNKSILNTKLINSTVTTSFLNTTFFNDSFENFITSSSSLIFLKKLINSLNRNRRKFLISEKLNSSLFNSPLSKLNKIILELYLQKFFLNSMSFSFINSYYILSTKLKEFLSIAQQSVKHRTGASSKYYLFINNFINLLLQGLKFKSLTGLADYLSDTYYYRKTQSMLIKLSKKSIRLINLNLFNVLGMTLLITGKLSRRNPRARFINFVNYRKGKFSSFDLKVQYAHRQAISNFGVYGIKI